MSVGGRTAWYCPNCGRPLKVGGACQSCGGAGVPQGPVEIEGNRGSIGALIRRIFGRLGGRAG